MMILKFLILISVYFFLIIIMKLMYVVLFEIGIGF